MKISEFFKVNTAYFLTPIHIQNPILDYLNTFIFETELTEMTNLEFLFSRESATHMHA